MLEKFRRRSTSRRPSADQQLEELISDHADAIYRVALSVVVDPHLAQDIVQETILKAWKALPGRRADASLRSWVLAIAHNTAVSYLRRLREDATEPAKLPEQFAPDDVERTAHGRDDLQHALALLQGLDELSREILVMCDIGGCSYAEIASALEVSIPVVKSRLLRARREIQRAMTERQEADA